MSIYNVALVLHTTAAPYLYVAPLGVKLERGERVKVENRYGHSEGTMAQKSFHVDGRGLSVLSSIYGSSEASPALVTGVYCLKELKPESDGTKPNEW